MKDLKTHISEGLLSADFDLKDEDVLIDALLKSKTEDQANETAHQIVQWLSRSEKPCETMLAKDLYIRWNEDDGTNSLSVYDLKTWQCWSLVWFPKKYFRRVRPAYDTRFVMPHDRGPHVTNFLVRSPQAQRLARTIMEIVKNETKSFREGILDVDFDISECDVLMGALTQSTTPQEAINAMENVERYLSNYTPPLKRLGRSGWWIRCAKSSPDKMISLTLYDRTASKYWCIRWSELNHKMQFNFGRIRFHVPPDSYVNYQVNKNKPEVWKLAEAIMQTTTKYKQNNFFI